MEKSKQKKFNTHWLSSIKSRAPIQTFALCLLFGGVLCSISLVQTKHIIAEKIESEQKSIMNQVVNVIQKPLLNNDTLSLQFILEDTTNNSYVVSSSLFDVNGNLVARSQQKKLAPKNTNEITQNIEFENTILGNLRIELDFAEIKYMQMNMFYSTAIIWIALSALLVASSLKNAVDVSNKIISLTKQLPGKEISSANEIDALISKIQPLIQKERESDISNNLNCNSCIFSGIIHNRKTLDDELSKENHDSLFEKLDLCVNRTIELYGGERIEGDRDTISFFTKSTTKSKQHILISLMAAHTLHEVVHQLSRSMGVNLVLSWSIHNDWLPLMPLFKFHESIQNFKVLSKNSASKTEQDKIVLTTNQFKFDELAAIARFKELQVNTYLLEGFNEQRQIVLQKQIKHLCNVCL